MKRQIICLLTIILIPQLLFANPNWEDNIPNQLQPWVKWVTRDLEPSECLFSYNNFNHRECLWLTKLSLNFKEKSADFSYQVVIDQEQFVTLPGSSDYWPQNVLTNSNNLPVVKLQNSPAVYLTPGQYTITGDYYFKDLPDKFPLPHNIALVDVILAGKTIPLPNLQDGKLVLNQAPAESPAAEANYLDLKVFRKIDDHLPAKVETLVKLDIAGKAREIKLNQISLAGFNLTNIESELPVKIDQQGNILIQAQAGSYSITATSYQNNALAEIAFPEAKDWVPYELWSFSSNPSLRVVDIEGGSAVDPSLYDIPSNWQSFNAYKVLPKQSLKIIERKRGEARQVNNSLALDRIIKLNFDGQSFSVKDQITGQIASEQHLTINPNYQLGNVNINLIDQLITSTSANKDLVGVEVRPGEINLSANSQIKDQREISFPGWMTEFNSANNRLYLPPGWQLFHIWGPDFVTNSWFAKWTLLDIFLLMLTVIAILKIFSWQSALLALVALLLFETTLFSISGVILFATALTALEKYLQNQKFLRFCSKLKILTISITGIIVLNALFTDIKLAIHPQLKRINFNYQDEQMPQAAYQHNDEGVMFESVSAPIGSADGAGFPSYNPIREKAARGLKKELDYASNKFSNYQNNIDQAVQTGTGVSKWQTYPYYTFGWETPIIQDQTIKFNLISPSMNIFLSFLKAILILLLLSRFLLNVMPTRLPFLKVLMLLIIFSNQQQAMAEDREDMNVFPDQQLLQDLGNYIITNKQTPPKCLPNCADISNFYLQINQEQMKLDFEIHSLENLFFPLPFNRNDIATESITLNDSSENLRLKTEQNSLLIALKKGINRVSLSGKIPDRETLNIAFPYVPSFGKYQANGWIVNGIGENGKVDQVVSLSKIEVPKDSKLSSINEVSSKREVLKLAQQFTISRQIHLAYDTTIETTISRISPNNNSFSIAYDLLEGESIITPGAEVKNGKLQVDFKPGENQKNYSSVLKVKDQINLQAANNKLWNEKWYLSASNLWHFEYSGTPRIYYNQEIPEWHPRPGESLTLKLEKPIGIIGSTKTIESLRLSSNLGKDLQNYLLNFEIKSSKGETHSLTLPEGIEVTAVKINSIAQSFKADSSKIDLNLSPGTQNIEIGWREKKLLSKFYRLPEINLATPVANLNINYQIPESHWVIATGGTKYGPAVLFWGYFPMVIILAWGLSYIKNIPLRFPAWILLLAGMSQINFHLNLIVIFWFIFLSLRSKTKVSSSSWRFPLIQIFLAFWTYWAFQALYSTIQTGLLGSPRMMITGNDSNSFNLNWYQDLTTGIIPTPWFFALDIWYYRILMLIWSLWLAASIIKWVKWGFVAYTTNGAWYQRKPAVVKDQEEKS